MKIRVASLLIFALLLLGCSAVGEENYVIAQKGDTGVDVEIVLSKCKELGFMQDQTLPKGENRYTEQYEPCVIQMEQALGLTADGIIRLNELYEIEDTIAVGSKGDRVKTVLEKLYELGYITEKLPASHNVYEEKYQAAVKNMEKKLKLTVDGILTSSEQEQLKVDQLPELPDVKNVSVKYVNGTASVAWNAVKGAVRYMILRDGKEIAEVKDKTSWVDATIEMDRKYSYRVKAATYFRESKVSGEKTIEIPFAQNITFVDCNYKNNNTLTYTSRIGTAKELKFSYENEMKAGNAVRVQKITQQKLANGCIRFNVIFCAPKGYNIHIFSPPSGRYFAYDSKGRTSGNLERIQFDISEKLLERSQYELTINIYRTDNDRFWVFPNVLKME